MTGIISHFYSPSTANSAAASARPLSLVPRPSSLVLSLNARSAMFPDISSISILITY